jgi:hypothetical protein
MEAPAYWSLDRKEKVWKKLCCLQARTIDFAKFEDCISTKGTGKEIRLFQEHG